MVNAVFSGWQLQNSEPTIFNDFLVRLKDQLSEKGRANFWQNFVIEGMPDFRVISVSLPTLIDRLNLVLPYYLYMLFENTKYYNCVLLILYPSQERYNMALQEAGTCRHISVQLVYPQKFLGINALDVGMCYLEKLSLITKAECEESKVSQEEADKLLVAAAKVDEKKPPTEAADTDDLVFIYIVNIRPQNLWAKKVDLGLFAWYKKLYKA